MPIVNESTYKSPLVLRNGHVATLVPSILRKVDGVEYARERISTPDQDFLDLDFVCNSNNQIVILSHGLEGNSTRPYMLGAARLFAQNNWDVCSWNCRSCGGEMNNAPRLYHHGDTRDLRTVVEYCLLKGYQSITLVGFSMGGSMITKYLGENANNVPTEVLGGVVFSIPTDLGGSARKLEEKGNNFYLKRFIRKLTAKIKQKKLQFPELISLQPESEINTFLDFDNAYTAPLYGFKDAHDFYESSRCDQFINGVMKPLLIVNALNDPFLSDSCYPYQLAQNSRSVWLEVPALGGHVGFMDFARGAIWSERRAVEFLESLSVR